MLSEFPVARVMDTSHQTPIRRNASSSSASLHKPAVAVSATPWNTLGHNLPAHQPLEVWAERAGLDWRIEDTPVAFESGSGVLQSFPEQRVLYRSDTLAPLSVVGSRYQVVQPKEVLAFYRDLVEVSGYELETAGTLKGGRKFWALARTGKSTVLKGTDTVNGYLLLATSCDGTLATTATPTTIRVVCTNTLSMALSHAGTSAIRVSHSTTFDPVAVKRQLGVAVTGWDNFMYRMKTLSERKVKNHEAMNYFLRVFCEPEKSPDGSLSNERALKKVQSMYEGQGRGSELTSAKGTAWGLLGAVTEYVDHERRARSQDNRLESAWFGLGANLKQKALEHALQLVA